MPTIEPIPKADAGQQTETNGHALGEHTHTAGISTDLRRRAVPVRPARVTLPDDQSALQRDRLLAELDGLQSADEAANWAHRSLPAKNTLTAADAQLIDAGFRDKLAAFGDQPSGEPSEAAEVREQIIGSEKAPRNGQNRVVAAKTVRLRDQDHRKFVSAQPCVVCGRSPADAHHLRFAQPRALGRKVSDEFTVPVCRAHHRELHRHGDEASWWKAIRLDPLPIALRLWQHARIKKSADSSPGE